MAATNNGFKVMGKAGIWLSAFLLLSIGCFAAMYVPAAIFWPAIFFSSAIPLIMSGNLLLAIFFLIKRSWHFLFPAVALTLGHFLTGPALVWNSSVPVLKDDISVLSFNAKFFRKPGTYQKFSSDMIAWAVDDTSKIKCFQEYSTNPQWMGLDVTGKLEQKGYNGFVVKSKMKNNDHSNGLAIFSTYPIVSSGIVSAPDSTSNGVIFTDLAVGKDTVRIYNVHLESMSLSGGNYISKIRKSSGKRLRQVKMLVAVIRMSPYPLIMCGDFNETPNSHIYNTLNSLLKNSFEEKGTGFGYTYNGPMFFLRIDHQFFGHGGLAKKSIDVLDYRVDRAMNISDHYPTFGYYRVRRSGL